MRPTTRCILASLGGFPVALLPSVFGAELWTLWFGYLGMMLALVAIDALFALPRRRLRVEVELPDMLYIGESDPLEISLSARSRRAVRLELLVDVDEGLEPLPLQRVDIPAGERVKVSLPLVPRRRGDLAVRVVWARWLGPFGLLSHRRVHRVDQEVAVVPNVRAVRAAALRYFTTREFLAGLKIEHYVGDGSEFDSLREYMPGLDHRAMNWKASARHRKLLCQEFRAERNQQIVLAVDTGQLMAEPIAGIPKLDHAINAALLLAYFSLRTGDRVGMYGFDECVRCFVEPAAGLGSFPRLQRRSSSLAYRHSETNFTLGLAELSMRLKRRSLVVLLTDFVDTITAQLMLENVARLSRRHLVLFVTLRDPDLAALAASEPRTLARLHESVVATDFIREREVVLERLRRRGVQCIDVPPELVSGNLLNRYLEIKRREMV